MSKQITYPAYFKTETAVIAAINNETALVAYKGGTVEVKNDKAFVAGAVNYAVATNVKCFYCQYKSNIELVDQLQKLLVN